MNKQQTGELRRLRELLAKRRRFVVNQEKATQRRDTDTDTDPEEARGEEQLSLLGKGAACG